MLTLFNLFVNSLLKEKAPISEGLIYNTLAVSPSFDTRLGVIALLSAPLDYKSLRLLREVGFEPTLRHLRAVAYH